MFFVYPTLFFRNGRIQRVWHLLVLVVCLAFYSPVALYIDLLYVQTPNVTCSFTSQDMGNLITYMDLGFRAVVPFILMLIFNLILIVSLFMSRNRILENFLTLENQTYYKEIRLSISCICMNMLYIATQLPVSLTVFNAMLWSDYAYILSLYIFYMSYSVNGYILLCTNSLFREKFFKIFKL